MQKVALTFASRSCCQRLRTFRNGRHLYAVRGCKPTAGPRLVTSRWPAAVRAV